MRPDPRHLFGRAGAGAFQIQVSLNLAEWKLVHGADCGRSRAMSLSFVEFVLCVPWAACAVLWANLLQEHGSWRWLYYISIMYSTAALIGTGLFYFPPARPRHDFEKTRWQEFIELDFTGLFLYTVGVTITLVGLSWAGTGGHAWRSASVIAPIVVGVILLICCFGYDWFIVSDEKAFFPLHLFRRFREFTVLLVVIFVAGMVYYSMSSLVPEATFYIFTNEPIQIGIISIPNGMGQLVGAIVMPAIMHWTRHPKWHIIAGIFIQSFFTAMFAYAVPGHKAAWMAFQFFGQGCFAWITVATVVNAGLHVQHSDLGLAAGLVSTFRAAGGSVGDAVYSTILNGEVDSRVAPAIAEAALKLGYEAKNLVLLIPAVIETALGVPGAFVHVPDATPELEAATIQAFHSAYGEAFKRVFWATIPFSVIALAAAFCIKDSTQYMTNHTAVILEKSVLGKTNDPNQRGLENHDEGVKA